MRHDLLGEAADVFDRAAKIDDHIFGPAVAQRLQFAADLVRCAEDRGVVAQFAHLGLVVAGKTPPGLAPLLGPPVDASKAFNPPHPRPPPPPAVFAQKYPPARRAP